MTDDETDGDVSDVETALEFSESRKTRFHLRRFLGKETRYEEVNGHIFIPESKQDPDDPMVTWCQNIGCEMPNRELAHAQDCPANLEGLESRRGHF